MLTVDTIGRIRREHFRKGKTIKEIARDLRVSRNTVRKVLRSGECQSAFKFDPGSASNFDPFERRVLVLALAPSELAGVAETGRARIV